MSIKYTQTDINQTYFCTFTCLDWLNLFSITDLYDELYKWFNLLIQDNQQVVAFVIMPNHLHVLLHITKKDKTINTILANGKRFLAYEIVKHLEREGRFDILKILSNAVRAEERKRKKKHRVFEVSSDIKVCLSEKFLLQKLNYIHSNPLRGKWLLADLPENYPHSSACFYELNKQHPKVKITHYRDVIGSVSSPAGDDT